MDFSSGFFDNPTMSPLALALRPPAYARTVSIMLPLYLILACVCVALAQSTGAPVPQLPQATAPGAELPSYLMQLGPYGAFAMAAWQLGRFSKGFQIGIEVRFTDGDRELIKRGVEAVEHFVKKD